MRKTIAYVESELSGCRELLHAARADLATATAKLDVERKQNMDAVTKLAGQIVEKDKSIAALKAELFSAHQTIATQKGYIARTLEDDNMRELGPVQPEPTPQPFQGVQSRRGGISTLSIAADDYGSGYGREKPKAWHDR